MCFTSVAQVLEGDVINSQSREGIVNVNVSINNTGIGTVTDSTGHYRITGIPQGRHKVVFSCIGFENTVKEVNINSAGVKKLNVLMSRTDVQLEEIQITASAERQVIREVKQQGVPVTVIDGKQLSGRGTSLSEVLNHQTSVKTRNTGGYGSQTKVNVRGLEGNRVQIYMDGYPLNTPDGNFSINDIPLQFIDRIEIYKGIVPPEFGGDGLGSAVNVVTIDADQDYYDAAYRIQSYGVHDGNITLRRYFEKIHTAGTLFIGGALARNDYTMNSPYTEGLKIKRDHDRLKMLDFAVGLNFMHNWFDESKIELLGYLNNKQQQGIQTNIRHTYTKALTLGANTNLEKHGFFLPNLDMKFYGAYLFINSALIDTSSFLYDFYGNKYPNSYGGEIGSIPNLSDDYTHDLRYNLNLKYKIIENKMSVNFNSDFRYVNMVMNDTVAERFVKKHTSGLSSSVIGVISSLALENKWFDKRLTSVLTGRHYNYGINGKSVDLMYGGNGDTPVLTDRSENKFGYSLALKYDLTKTWFAKLAAEHNYRLPRYEEILGDRVSVMTSPALEPEEAFNYNIGILFDKYYNRYSRLQFEANTYYSEVKNMMYLLAQAGYSKYQNLGQAMLYGIDAEIKWDINESWFVSFNATWQKTLDYSKYVFGTNTPSMTYKMQVPHIPVLYFNWMVDYRKDNPFNLKGQYTRIYYEGGYTDKYYYGYELSRNQDYSIPSTCLHTIGMEYGFFNRKIILGAECHNLFNTEEMNNFNYPLAGRTFSLKIRVTTLKW